VGGDVFERVQGHAEPGPLAVEAAGLGRRQVGQGVERALDPAVDPRGRDIAGSRSR
jgi:hypothetical protein